MFSKPKCAWSLHVARDVAAISKRAVLGALTLLGACSDLAPAPAKLDTQKTTPPDGISYVGFEAPTIIAGVHTAIRAIVHAKLSDRVGAGVPVRWQISPAFGTFDDTISFTDSGGGANMGWQPATKAGGVVISVIAGTPPGVTGTLNYSINPGPATRVVIGSDSVRFTRVGVRPLAVTVYDQYDNRTVGPSGLAVAVSPVGSITAATQADSLYINSGRARATAEVTLSRKNSTEPLARVKVVSDLVAKTITLVGGIGSEVGVRESAQFKFVASDSNAYPLSLSAAELGIQFSSSDSALISVNSGGLVTGQATGSATITASVRDTSVAILIAVIASYDLGALTPLYTISMSYEGLSVGPVLFANDGASAVVEHSYASHPYSPGNFRLRWYSPNGSSLQVRTFNYDASATVTPDGNTFVSYPLSRYDSQGALVWSTSVNGETVVADSELVVVGTPGGVVAYDPAGAFLWSYSNAGQPAYVSALTPTRLYASVGSGFSALTRTGTGLWTVALPGAGIADDQGMFFGVIQRTLSALGADGATKWTFTTGAYSPTFTLGPNQSLILGDANKLRWLDRATGAERFSVATPFTIGPPITVVGSRLFAISGGYLYVYDAATGQSLGRTTSKSAGGVAFPKCTSAGLAVTSATQVALYARCE